MSRNLRDETRHARDSGTERLAARIALNGGQLSHLRFKAPWVPYCDTPVDVYRAVRPGVWSDVRSLEATMKAPCRRCAKCLQYRQLRWRDRALAELLATDQAGRRSWFVTLTFSPAHLAGILLEAGGENRPLAQIERAGYRHVQRYYKRLRKAGCAFRYLAIMEYGEESDRMHYHLFLHEKGPKPVLKETIEAQWRSIVHARLVRGETLAQAASYLTKYATKSMEIRPRASGKYGHIPSPQIKLPKESFFGVQLRPNCGENDDDTQRRNTSSCDPALEND